MFIPLRIEIRNLLSFERQVFVFRQGEAILIVGNNLDDKGQKGNGSGKSSIGEAIALALTGGSIRSVKTRELVRDGEESAQISLFLKDSQNKSIFEIHREVFAKETKSSTCSLFEDDVEVKTCADINDYNKYIFTKIGISKEDFFNFYLITKEQYSPFLSTGDTKKKEIINRFSGADKIDKVDEFIDRDSEVKQNEINIIVNKLASSKGRSELLSEQITKEKESNSEIERQKRISLLEEKIDEYKTDLACSSDRYGDEATELIELEKKVKEKKDKKPDFETRQEKLRIEYQHLSIKNSVKTEESKNVVKKYQSEIDGIKATETSCIEEIDKLKVSLKNEEKSLLDLQNKIAGAITCPKCSHEFTLQYKDFDVELAKKQVLNLIVLIDNIKIEIVNYQEVLDLVEPDKEKINEKISKDRESIKLELEKINTRAFEIDSEQQRIRKEKQDYEVELESLEKEVKEKKELLSSLEEKDKGTKQAILDCKDSIIKLKSPDNSKVEQLQKDLELELNSETSFDSEIKNLTEQKQKIDEWYGNFKAFKSYLANQSIRDITDYTNLFLNAMNSNLSINIEGYRMLVGGKKLKEEITTIVFKDGFEKGSYGKFSAGERGRIELSVILAMQNLINLNTKTGGLDLLICDEILDSVDSLGLENIIGSLQGIDSTIMIISQNDINSLKESTIVIEKENGISTIKIS